MSSLIYKVKLTKLPVTINDILGCPKKGHGKLKYNGKKDRLGYKQLSAYFEGCPKFDKPINISIVLYQTKRSPFDIDAVLKTLLDYLVFDKIIKDDNETGIKSLNISYAKGYYERKMLQLSFKQ